MVPCQVLLWTSHIISILRDLLACDIICHCDKWLPQHKYSGPSIFLSSILSSGSVLVVLAPNQTISLDGGMSILKGGILAILQSTLTTSNSSSLKNNLWLLYKLLSSFSLLSIQLQSWIWTPYIKISFQPSLVTQLLQNTSPQIASGLWIQMVFSSFITKSMYCLLVTSAHAFSSIIMITSLLNIMVKTKY